MSEKKWIYIIGFDIIVSIFCFFINHFYDLTFVFVTFLTMMLSGFVGLVFVFFEEHRSAGSSLLINVIIIPILFSIMCGIGRFMDQNNMTTQHLSIDYKTKRFSLVLYGEEHYRTRQDLIKDNSYHLFKISLIDYDCNYELEGYYEKTSDNKYLLIVNPSNKPTINIDGWDYICKDTMIMSKGKLYGFVDIPLRVKSE